MSDLQHIVAVQAEVLRDGAVTKVPREEVVPGDVVLLSAGASVPADCRLLETRDLFVNEATLTGETFPVEKTPSDLPADTPLAGRSNALFQGTNIVSGIGRALVVRTGRNTQFGAIAERLRIRPQETDFERGVRQFGMLLIRVTLILVILIFAFNVYLHRPVLDSFLFALALAVGLTPELLPAIISVNLATGARRMAARKVIVKRLVSIENFGCMDVLCSDKTGTLTEGKVRLDGALDVEGNPSARALQLAAINAAFQTGFHNPIDDAIVAAAGQPTAAACASTKFHTTSRASASACWPRSMTTRCLSPRALSSKCSRPVPRWSIATAAWAQSTKPVRRSSIATPRFARAGCARSGSRPSHCRVERRLRAQTSTT